MRLYNTLTRTEEEFAPSEDGLVREQRGAQLLHRDVAGGAAADRRQVAGEPARLGAQQPRDALEARRRQLRERDRERVEARGRSLGCGSSPSRASRRPGGARPGCPRSRSARSRPRGARPRGRAGRRRRSARGSGTRADPGAAEPRQDRSGSSPRGGAGTSPPPPAWPAAGRRAAIRSSKISGFAAKPSQASAAACTAKVRSRDASTSASAA